MPLNVYHAQQGITLCMFVFHRWTTPMPLNVYHAQQGITLCMFCFSHVDYTHALECLSCPAGYYPLYVCFHRWTTPMPLNV